MGLFSDLLKKGFKLQKETPQVQSSQEANRIENLSYLESSLANKSPAEQRIKLFSGRKNQDESLGAEERQKEGLWLEAKNIYEEALEVIADLFAELESDQEIDTTRIYEIVKKVLSNINLDSSPLLNLSFTNSQECYLYAHSVNVMILSMLVSRELNYSDEQILELGCGAFLHDIGLIKFLPKINSNVKLSGKEYEEIMLHPVLGVKMADKLKIISEGIIQTIKQTHERINGKGYPEGVKRPDMHEYALIVGLVDVYEALTHLRPYRESPFYPNPLEEIIKYQSDAFDANLVKVLMRIAGIFTVGSTVELNTSEIAKVTEINKGFPLRPKVNILFDSSRHKLLQLKAVDLSKNYSIYIKRPIEAREEHLSNL